MLYKRIEAPQHLQSLIDCFWIAEDGDPTPVQQKIIPDGFPEIIFHYGDHFRIKLREEWKIQTKELLAGQITRYFFLENSGISGMFGIKLKPTALAKLYALDMSKLTDKVVDLTHYPDLADNQLARKIKQTNDHDMMEAAAVSWFSELLMQKKPEYEKVDEALDIIIKEKGRVTVGEVIGKIGISRRHLERLFKKKAGLSPKQYIRVVRFSNIFKLMEEKDASWVDLTYKSGFYDQSHFIKDFREFTGENPTNYLFDEQNMANFFMDRPG